ncbi:hypothetical protein EON80_12770 [bacterium]|nr:MAG: hypothetical protein EON80_12770 [bacterium]
MNTALKLKLASAATLLSLFVAWAYPIARNSSRPVQSTTPIKTAFAKYISVEEAFELSFLTRLWVVSEGGPCLGNGCNGGLLNEISAEAKGDYGVMTNLPVSKGNSRYLWFYGVEPTQVTRLNDAFGEDRLAVRGRLRDKSKVYFTVLPGEIALPIPLQITVETGMGGNDADQ